MAGSRCFVFLSPVGCLPSLCTRPRPSSPGSGTTVPSPRGVCIPQGSGGHGLLSPFLTPLVLAFGDLFLLLVCLLDAFKVDCVVFLIPLLPFHRSLGLPTCAGVSRSLEAAIRGSLLTTSGHSLCLEKRNGSPFSIWAGHCVAFVTLVFLFQEELLFYCRTIYHKGPSVL